jgi:hypothetical protein
LRYSCVFSRLSFSSRFRLFVAAPRGFFSATGSPPGSRAGFLLLVVLLAPISSYFSCADFVPAVGLQCCSSHYRRGRFSVGFVVLQSNPAASTSFSSPGSVVVSRASSQEPKPTPFLCCFYLTRSPRPKNFFSSFSRSCRHRPSCP